MANKRTKKKVNKKTVNKKIGIIAAAVVLIGLLVGFNYKRLPIFHQDPYKSEKALVKDFVENYKDANSDKRKSICKNAFEQFINPATQKYFTCLQYENSTHTVATSQMYTRYINYNHEVVSVDVMQEDFTKTDGQTYKYLKIGVISKYKVTGDSLPEPAKGVFYVMKIKGKTYFSYDHSPRYWAID